MSKDWQSQARVRWVCKYHVVMVPKYRKKDLFGRMRRGTGKILRDLCLQKGIGLEEGKAMPDHVQMLLSIPPKYSIAPAWCVTPVLICGLMRNHANRRASAKFRGDGSP